MACCMSQSGFGMLHDSEWLCDPDGSICFIQSQECPSILGEADDLANRSSRHSDLLLDEGDSVSVIEDHTHTPALSVVARMRLPSATSKSASGRKHLPDYGRQN